MTQALERYKLMVDNVPAKIEIRRKRDEFVPIYEITSPTIEPATQAVFDAIIEKIISEVVVKPIEVFTPEELEILKVELGQKSRVLIKEKLPHLSEGDQEILIGILLHKSLGLGKIELLLQDRNIEEIVVNNSKEPIWVYHIRFGWLKTNIKIPTENEIYNYASLIGRRVGTQITYLNPLMDAYLTTGDRLNATLFPISTTGNTLTIRKFARRPWTITDFIELKTISVEVSAFLWLALQYEINILVTGGTASGKTSMLNVLMSFIPPNHRIISIEETREIQLPKFLHWLPMTSRPPNPEGKGEITMLQLMINALRMRPDRVIVGEIRRSKEANVLFEAIHTGHSVYSTLHANTAGETLRRLSNPPINIPKALLSSLQLILVMHRDRRRGIRRVLELSELISSELKELSIELNPIFRWMPSEDKIKGLETSRRVIEEIKHFTGMDDREIRKDLNEKEEIIKLFVKNKIKDTNKIGSIVSQYYTDPGSFLGKLKINKIKSAL